MAAATINSMERTTAVANLVDALRRKILLQELKDGEAITENAIAGEYGLSRGTVRTALQALEGEGVIATLPSGRKMVVGVTEKFIHDIYHTRMVVECEAARQILGMKQVDFAEIASMVSCFQGVAEAPIAVMRDERTRVNMQFHRALVRMSRNRPLFQCWNAISPMLGALIKFNSDTLVPETHVDDYVVSHTKIVEMFLAHNPELIAYLEYHTFEAAYKDTLAGFTAVRRSE
ncbi:MAG: GntR family transcriptional regulator [Planctomycetes bacterium]|nr:GntR family transcriptional regulator [Planctomycetota bacterium]